MIKTILVPATASDSDLTVFGSALSIARPFGAHIDALHAHLDPIEVAVRLTSDPANTPLVGGFIEKLEEDFRAREERAKRKLTAEWHVETGEKRGLFRFSE